MNTASLIRANTRSTDETDRLLKQKDMELKKMQELIAKMKNNMNVSQNQQRNSNNLITFGQKVPISNNSNNHHINTVNRINNIINNQRNQNENNFNGNTIMNNFNNNQKLSNIISYQSITTSNSTSI